MRYYTIYLIGNILYVFIIVNTDKTVKWLPTRLDPPKTWLKGTFKTLHKHSIHHILHTEMYTGLWIKFSAE